MLQTKSSRWLAGVALVVVIVAIVGVTVAFLYRSGELPLLPEGTPEGTVHRFLSAIEQSEIRQAYEYLGLPLQETCSYEHFRDSVRWFDSGGSRTSGDLRVILEGTRPIDEAVEVRVRIVRFRYSRPSPLAPPFTGGESSYDQRFTLEMTDGNWLFVDPPWPMNRCPEPKEVTPKARPPGLAPA